MPTLDLATEKQLDTQSFCKQELVKGLSERMLTVNVNGIGPNILDLMFLSTMQINTVCTSVERSSI